MDPALVASFGLTTLCLVNELKTRVRFLSHAISFSVFRVIYKKTLAGMQYAAENLNDDVYYTSCDDDFMIDVGGLIIELNKLKNEFTEKKWPESPILCSFGILTESSPSRDPKSKYLEPEEEYRWPFWPTSCLGGAYTTSVSVARQLLESSRSEKPLRMDDVWITGVLREKIGMPRQYVKSFKPSLAKHYSGYAKFKSKARQVLVTRDWENIYKKFKHETVCTCEVYL